MAGFNPRTAKLDELASWLGSANIDSINYNIGMAEFTRRQTQAQIDASNAQIKAADAEVKAADAAVKNTSAAQKNTKYMLASVIVAAVAAIASAVSALVTVHPAWFK